MTVKNGISAISNEVLADIQKEAEAIIKEAELEAKKIFQAAKQEADQKYRDVLNQSKTRAIAERRKIASITEVEMRNHFLSTKEELVDSIFQRAVNRFKSFVEKEEYHTYMLKLIEDTAQKIGKKDLKILINDKDARWLTQEIIDALAKKLQIELKLSNSKEQFIGGCIIQTKDEKIIYTNTIDNRLEELKPILRVEVAKILFGET